MNSFTEKKNAALRAANNYFKSWWNKNKILFWIIIFIVVLFSLPIFPRSETLTLNVSVPYQVSPGERHPEQGIEVINSCYSSRLSKNPSKLIRLRNSDEIQTVNLTFKGYDVHIHSIVGCDDCADEFELNLNQPTRCSMPESSVFGYFEQCNDSKCNQTSFVVAPGLEIVAPNKEFKMAVQAYITKRKIQSGDNYPVHSTYDVEIVTTYPAWKPLPYTKWIGTLLLFLIDPIRGILKYATEHWFY